MSVEDSPFIDISLSDLIFQIEIFQTKITSANNITQSRFDIFMKEMIKYNNTFPIGNKHKSIELNQLCQQYKNAQKYQYSLEEKLSKLRELLRNKQEFIVKKFNDNNKKCMIMNNDWWYYYSETNNYK